MTEWGVVGVLIALAGLGGVLVKPMLSLNTAITRLTGAVERLQQDMAAMTARNSESHSRIYAQLADHDERIDGHEQRLCRMEGGAAGAKNRPSA